ncbi:hypothetical protein [Palleronia sp. LCG004]|uniref:hypothetical protein n=1 Tax=Palleronia sp. LCG004 TaxID=3079304 RepID=UPI002941F10E|nr:hypothetical protein [Palleronia sp. LCG004]WOI55869.1 hypothetical protein RVY76_12630 [Palleronia sp. LCG004]
MAGPTYSVMLEDGEPAVLWELGPVISAGYPGFPAPTPFGLDYVFRNGFTGTDPLPCRRAFLTEMRDRPIDLPAYWKGAGFYAPNDIPRVEFDGFAYTPTHRRRFLRATFVAREAGDHAFDLSTCGGVRLWVDGAEAARFEPFQRNAARSTRIVLPLREGANEILMHMEDLFERDTNWSAALVNRSGASIRIEIGAEADSRLIAAVRDLAAEIRPARDYFLREPMTLVFEEALETDLPIRVRIVSHQHDRATLLDTDAILKAGETRLTLDGSLGIREGFHRVLLTFRVGDVSIERQIDAAFLDDLAPFTPPDTEDARKREALEHAARNGDPRIGRLLALYATDAEDTDPAAIEAILDATLSSIEAREDCSDFVMVPLLWVWGLYRDRLPAAHRARIRHAILDYRYWVDEPGNDVMWFWSENHVLCFHVSQYIAGHLFPDAVFTCSGRTGAEQKRLAEERLPAWFDAVEAHGFVEWNSAAYYPIDFIGLFGLVGWAKGPLEDRCRALLDRLFAMIGLHTLAGVPAGSQGRAYDKELKAGPLTELAPFCRVAFGEGWLGTGVAALPLYCLSDYAAPSETRHDALFDGPGGIEARYTQGHDHNGKLVLWKDRASMLSSVVEHDPGTQGHQQHVVDIRLSGHPMARLWINHPGETDPWGIKRPSFWSGNSVLPLVGQHRDHALLLYDLGDAPEVEFVHIFAARDGLDALEAEGHWLFARAGDGYAAIWASGTLNPVVSGATAGREFRLSGRRSGWIVRVASGAGEAGFHDFKDEMRALSPVFSGDGSRLSLRVPDGVDLTLDWSAGLSVDGSPAPFDALSPAPRVSRGVAPKSPARAGA